MPTIPDSGYMHRHVAFEDASSQQADLFITRGYFQELLVAICSGLRVTSVKLNIAN